jgi:dipeptidyl aminopeptidase/acylaminoacyl peptidase
VARSGDEGLADPSRTCIEGGSYGCYATLIRRVPVEQAIRLRDALAAHDAPVTWMLYRDEGHGWSSPDKRADWFRQIEKFLAANDGPASAH